MVLKGLPVDVEDELAHFIVKINSCFDATNLVRKSDWENRNDIAEGNARFIEVCLVEGDVNCLALGMVLGNHPVLFPSHEELKLVCPNQTSCTEELDDSGNNLLATIQIK